LGKVKAFSGFAVDDIDKAEKFYRDTLGLDTKKNEEMGGLLELHLAGGNDIMIYPKPDFVPATYTILNFPVDDVDQAVIDLRDKGVNFERYEGFDQDENGIARGDQGPAIAWFKDPAGNILSVLESTEA
jgi:catechol 2,3-dioxygenase-like lactoylglutathione lyase family enzyme